MTTVTLPSGQLLEFVDHGGDGPAVLLLHSFLMSTDMFAPQVAAFGGEVRLVAMNSRGHAGTPVDGSFDFWDVARDALALLDHLDIARTAVVGVSQGGFVGLRMALLAPDRIDALAVLGSSAAAEDAQVAANYQAMNDVWAAQGAIDPLLDAFATICLGTTDVGDEWRERWRAYSAEKLDAILTPLVGRDDLLPRLAEISTPTLVLHGTADLAYPVERAAEIVRGVPAAEPLVTVDNGAHFLSFTHPDDVNPHLRAFLAKHLLTNP